MSAARLAAALSALALLAGAGRAGAELREVRQIAKGMECAECARNLTIEVRKLDGVEAASASWNRRVLTLRFAPGARATLAEVRAVLRRQHFIAGEAEVVVAGRLGRTAAGAPLLDGGTGVRFRLELGALAGTAGVAPPEGGEGREVLVTGRVLGEEGAAGQRAADPAAEPGTLFVTSLRLKADAGHDDSPREIRKGTP